MTAFVEFTGKLDDEAPASNLTPFSGQLDKPATPAQPPGWREQLMRQLGLAARYGITGATGVGGALADAGVGVANLMGANLPQPSQAMQQKLTQLGLPEPQGQLEKVIGGASTMVAGGLDPSMMGIQRAVSGMVPQGFVPPQETAKAQVAAELRQAGYKLPPSKLEAGTIARSAEGIGGVRRTGELAQVKNQSLTQRLATKELDLPPNTPLTTDTLEAQARQLVREGYDPIRGIGRVGIGSKYRQELRGIVDDLADSRSFPMATRDEISAEVTKYLYYNDPQRGLRPIQEFTGDDAIRAIKLLRSEAKTNFKRDNPLLGEAQRRIATALENQIETHLSSKAIPGVNNATLQNFRNTRTMLAKNFAVERMLVDPDTGIVDAAKAHTLLQAGTPLSGGLRTIAKAGSPAFKEATAAPIKGTPTPLNVGDSMWYGAGVGGAMYGGPQGAIFAALPAIRAGARHGVLSEPVQNAMVQNLLSGNTGLMGSPAAQRMVGGMPMQIPFFTQGQQ